MDVGVVTASEGCVVIDVLVMEVVDEDVVPAGVSGDATGREVDDEEEVDTVEAVDVGVSAWGWCLDPKKSDSCNLKKQEGLLTYKPAEKEEDDNCFGPSPTGLAPTFKPCSSDTSDRDQKPLRAQRTDLD
ncbi:hypothetical protein NDU88_001875 [Pleurodeles waltl]|uniref:Uncharacterized protein n=1 Tax=Pleurodeles waltl TaxID=8319 RepID=A0AAV7U7R1_PLEWA|nr:hypothetical protein NDU88_001875 [Pleurodeles waltl]